MTFCLPLIETVSILYHFIVIPVVSYLLKVADFNLSHLHLAPPLRVTLFEFWHDRWHQKTSPWVTGIERPRVIILSLDVLI